MKGSGRTNKLVVGALLVALTLLGALLWREQARRSEAEKQVALNTAQVLSMTFKDARTLVVRRGKGSLRAKVDDPGAFGLVPSSQGTTAPFTVDYSLDLSKLNASSYRWDADSRTMFVELPEIAVERPNIDMTQAVTTQTGLFVSRGAGLRLGKRAATSMAVRADAVAREPEQMEKARQAALTAVEGITAAPLRAAGLNGVTVVPVFASEGRRSRQRWDASVPVSVLLGAE